MTIAKCGMPKNGLRIKNYQAGSIYGCELGVRDNYDYNNAVLSDSLFSRFLYNNGLNVYKEKSTRDVICIEFDYGIRSFEDEIKHINKLIKQCREDKTLSDEQQTEKITKLEELYKDTCRKESMYDKKSADDIREIFYQNGVNIKYQTKNKSGKVIKEEIIHYKMLYRTPGKAKKGSCMFINEKLYDMASSFLRMDIELPFENSPIVEMGAYSSLITSSICGTVNIEPENIFIMKDVDSFFNTNIISVETDENKHCIALEKSNYRLKNTLFDGQALIDEECCPEWAEGYILLRHHLCKTAAFKSKLQLFFKDYFGDKYETATITDMFGVEHYVKDIKMITTDNAMKWLKFNISYEYWCDKVHENGCEFGVVKTAHQSKFGDVQRMSYQMTNALDISIMDKVSQCSMEYIEALKTNDDVFLKYLNDNINFSNDFEALIALCKQDPEFVNSTYFRERKKEIIKTYVLNMKNGRLMQNADNLVIVGSPYAMLLCSVGEAPENDDTFAKEEGTIQCFTTRFNDGEYLAEFRSPFNSKNNMGYLHNVYDDRFFRYFDFGKQIIAVNMIETDFQDRNNGSDQDSDSIYVTNLEAIVEYAKYCYLHYPTIVNNIPKEQNSYTNTLLNHAIIDNKLAAAQLAIGESSNLAQLCLSYTYNFTDKKYQEYVCILSVLAQIAIDNAKRTFDIKLTDEIKRIKKDMDIRFNGYPKFWTLIKRNFNTSRVNKELDCPMNYLYDTKIEKYHSNKATLPMSVFFHKHELIETKRRCIKVEKLIEKFSIKLYEVQSMEYDDSDDKGCEYNLLNEEFDELISDIKSIYISNNYVDLISYLIDRAFYITTSSKNNKGNSSSLLYKNRSILLSVLYSINPKGFLACFDKNVKKSVH